MEEKILVTGAGTGFGKGIVFELAKRGAKVIAGVEIMSQVSALKQEAADQGLSLQVEKLDVTNPRDREKAWSWDIDVLLNNAGVAEGGSLADIPEESLRRQFEVNVFGPILLTKGFARRMVQKNKGRIVFMSSISGLSTDPFMGPYCGTKHTLEAFAQALSKELQEFNIEVATINPGPYLTGFNDRGFETWKNWQDDPSERIFDYEKLAFPYEQMDPKEVIEPSIKVVMGQTNSYRNVVPEKMASQIKKQMDQVWQQKTDEALGTRHKKVQKAYDLAPGTLAENE